MFDGTPDLIGGPPYQAMVEAAPTAMFLVDGAGRIRLVNAEAERMFGYPRLALIGTPIARLLPDGVGAAAGDARGIRADGRELPVETGLTPIDTPDGPCVLAVVTDIGERARAEAAHAHLAAIVESSDDAIIGKTLAGIVVSWNRAAVQILGWTEAEMVGQPILRIIPADRWDEEKSILARVMSGWRVEDLATVRQRRDGSLVPVSITVSPIRDRHGRVVGASKILRDATERRRGERAMSQANAALELAVAERTRELAEQQQALRRAEAALAQSQKLEAVGQLTGGVAHDFNNLLTVISGNLDLIQQQLGDDDRLGRAIAGIGRAVERGARLTGHLLAFARQQTLQPEPVRLEEAVRDVCLLAMRALGEAIRVSIDAEPALWPCRLDRAQFESALLNLALNARDAMPAGGVLAFAMTNATVAGDPDLVDGRYVALEVADTGTGMKPEVAARAVEPFFTTKAVGKGSGLGLSQVFGFVRQSGGMLRIASRPGHGTRVTLLFPACADAAG